MNIDSKKAVRKIVESQKGWNIIWGAGITPCEFLHEKVELIYEDMDGQPQSCYAIYTIDEPVNFNLPYFKRESDGAHMIQCLAWRYITNAKN